MIRLKELIQEIEFTDQADFDSYASAHKMRDTTRVKIAGKDTTAGEANPTGIKPKKKKKKKAKKKKVITNPFIKKYGKLKLNAFPPEGVDEKSVKVNIEGNIHTHAVLQWKDPKSGRTVSSYTNKFMEKNAKIKWSRIKKIKDEHIEKINDKATKLLRNRDTKVRDAGAIISIIAQTGLRPGSALGFDDTGNRGVSTIGPENVTIKGDKITLNFVGKSYKPNNAVIKDKALAEYLTKRMSERKSDNFLFDITTGQLGSTFTKISKKGMKIKDMRTFAATKMAKNILDTDKTPPPPLPESQTAIKKAVKDKLKIVYEQVSQRLNNTPAMAKSSYVHPKVIEQWLKDIGVEPTLIK